MSSQGDVKIIKKWRAPIADYVALLAARIGDATKRTTITTAIEAWKTTKGI